MDQHPLILKARVDAEYAYSVWQQAPSFVRFVESLRYLLNPGYEHQLPPSFHEARRKEVNHLFDIIDGSIDKLQIVLSYDDDEGRSRALDTSAAKRKSTP